MIPQTGKYNHDGIDNDYDDDDDEYCDGDDIKGVGEEQQHCNSKLGSILIIALQIIRMIWGITMLMILGLSKNEHGAPLKMEQNFC